MSRERKNILCLVGTRPEAIKMAPVIMALKAAPWACVTVALSGQHRELALDALAAFGITPDVNLDVMVQNQSLPGLTGRLFQELETFIKAQRPDLIIAQGDTTTVMVVGMTCFYLGIDFVHLEAGLRTGNLRNPFPEEVNRIICGRVAALHLAPTQASVDALISEGVARDTIVLVGNTVIDALLQQSRRLKTAETQSNGRKLILMTAHRRENFGAPLERVLTAIRDVVESSPSVELLYPVHPNPNVQSIARRVLGGHDRISLCEPLRYDEFISAMLKAHIIVSDSGGVQEEAPALAKPVLVIRETTERPEAVNAGVARLIGTEPEIVRAALIELLTDRDAYQYMARGVSPYGDGQASARIVDALEVYFGLKPRRKLPDFDADRSVIFESGGDVCPTN